MDGAKEKEKPVKSWFHLGPRPFAGIFLSKGKMGVVDEAGPRVRSLAGCFSGLKYRTNVVLARGMRTRVAGFEVSNVEGKAERQNYNLPSNSSCRPGQ